VRTGKATPFERLKQNSQFCFKKDYGWFYQRCKTHEQEKSFRWS